MKRNLLIALLAVCIRGILPAQILISEDFEAYTPGASLAQSAGDPWTTWGNAPGGVEDAVITTEQANSGTNSVLFSSTTPASGGPVDMILKLGDHTTGIYNIRWQMFIPSGNGGYFNIQHEENVTNGNWALDVFFRANGDLEMQFDQAANATVVGSYPQDEWFEVDMLINLNISQGVLTVAGGEGNVWPFNTFVGTPGMNANQLGAINFFAYAGGDAVRYYVDDVLFEDQSSTNVQETGSAATSIYPNPVNDILTIEVPGGSGTTFFSLLDLTGRTILADRAFQQQGNVARSVISMAGMPSGAYFLRIGDARSGSVYRIVKN